MTTTTLGRPPASATFAPALFDDADLERVNEARFALVGQLAGNAKVRTSADGEHMHLTVRILQPMHGTTPRPVFVATLRAHSNEVQIMAQLAKRLTVGARCLAICRGIDWDEKHHELRAWRCDRLTAIAPEEVELFVPDSRLEATAP